MKTNQIEALRAFDVHLGDLQRQNNGYIKKGGMFRVTWSEKDLIEKISLLPEKDRTKASEAFEWLLNCEGNSYKQFIKMRHFYLRKEWKFNVYDYNQRSEIETALWPHLYPYDDWCETFLRGNESRISTKV